LKYSIFFQRARKKTSNDAKNYEISSFLALTTLLTD